MRSDVRAVRKLFWFSVCLGLVGVGRAAAPPELSGELKKWHTLTLTFTGPETSEEANPNPFLDYRLVVTFRQGARACAVPGFFAADGRAAETSATAGNKWRAHFVPDATGEWTWEASFRSGLGVAVSLEPGAGQPTAFDGARGRFKVGRSDKRKPDFRARGRLNYAGQRYLRFADSGEWFLKGGADSPENFLAYFEFDGVVDRKFAQGAVKGEAQRVPLHRYAPHAADWRRTDPTWQGGKGKNIIGALNYLSSKGMNSVYFLTMNVGGDGDDVWPWTAKDQRQRFDASKLDQWDLVFSHMDKRGLMLHVVTQETENDQLLDGGDLGVERKLYYRELIARFSHHLALTWNLGEENTNTDDQRQAFAGFIRDLDPYDHPLVVHTYPGEYDKVYEPLLGFPHFEGPSLQLGKMSQTHAETAKWVARAAARGRPWMVCLDEIGPADIGVKPDADDHGHDQVRKDALWGNLMAGGAGCEWYFGYKFAHNDLGCEDWRARDHLWDLTRYALDFFQRHVPFAEMTSHDELLTGKTGFCLAKPGSVYLVYLPDGGTGGLELADGDYSLQWFNPRQGGPLVQGSLRTLQGPGTRQLGLPPKEPDQDWVALIRKTP